MPKKKTNSETPTIDFEKSLNQLTQLIERMEKGNLPLEESLQCFEQGVGLIRECQTALTQAEQKVQILSQQRDSEDLKPYTVEDEDDN